MTQASTLSPLWFLARRLAWNRAVRQLRRLRTPRYAIALVIGIAYFAVLLTPDNAPPAVNAELLPLARLLAPLGVAMYLAWSWLWGGHRRALAFSPAEAQFLFPAPLTRRWLILYKLLRAQPPLILSVILFAVLARGAPLPWLLRLPSFWLLLSTLHLHQVAASLVHASADAAGVSGLRRNAVPLVLFAAALGTLVYGVVTALPELGNVASAQELARRADELMRAPAAAALLLPFDLLLGAVLAEGAREWARALPATLLLLLLHVAWVLRSDTAFEEAAADAGRRRAVRLAAARAQRPEIGRARGARRTLLPLRRGQHPAAALVWKNVITFARGLRRNTLFLMLALLPLALAAALTSIDSTERAARGLGTGALILAALVTVLGPLGIRNDLREDLARLAVIRTYPLRGRAIVAAEVASSGLVLTLPQLAVAGLGLGALAVGRVALAEGPGLLLAWGSCLLILPPINALALAIQNGLAIHFPAWLAGGASGAGGVEFMGHNILRLGASVLLLGIGLLGPSAIAAAVMYAGLPALGAWAVLPAALLGTAALWFVVVLTLIRLGDAFDRLEPGVD